MVVLCVYDVRVLEWIFVCVCVFAVQRLYTASCEENVDTSEQGANRTITSRWETSGWSEPASVDARKTAGMGRHSPRHLCRVAYTIYVGFSLCTRREVRCEQEDDKV